MIGRLAFASAAVGALVLAAAPARAGDQIFLAMALATSVQHEAPSEFAAFGSVRVTFRTPKGTTTGIADFDRKRFKFVDADGETGYFVGTTLYSSDRSGAWSKLDFAKSTSAAPKPTEPDRLRRALDAPPRRLPDQRVRGVLMGALAFNTRAKDDHGHYVDKIATMTCLYDKATRYFRSCTSERYAMTFDHYDDPANDFTIPVAALRAREISFPAVK
jgi:hypothetical protein